MKARVVLSVFGAAALGVVLTGGSPAAKTEHSTGRNHAASEDKCEAVERLNGLDPRKPVPLQPMMAWHQKQNMQEHLVAIQGIADGLARGDWEGVARSSARIGSAPDTQQMCEHMGAGASGFTELALEFHRRADAIGEAAQARDITAVLRATSDTLRVCTQCHSTYRQEIVDATTWNERAASAQSQ